jgi:hypothetical protein
VDLTKGADFRVSTFEGRVSTWTRQSKSMDWRTGLTQWQQHSQLSILQRDDSNRALSIIEINYDITERKESEEALQLSEKQLLLSNYGKYDKYATYQLKQEV